MTGIPASVDDPGPICPLLGTAVSVSSDSDGTGGAPAGEVSFPSPPVEEPLSRSWRDWAAGAGAVAAIGVPVDVLVPAPNLSRLLLAAAAAGTAATISTPTWGRRYLAGVAVVAAVAAVAGTHPLTLLMPFLYAGSGLAAGLRVRSVRHVLWVAVGIAAVATAEFTARKYLWHPLWPGEARWVPGPDFRARGTLGHPLPTAAVVTAAAAAVAVTCLRDRRRLVLCVLATLAVAYMCGARSSLLAAGGAVAAVSTSADTLGLVWRRFAASVGVLAVAGVSLVGFLDASGAAQVEMPRVLAITDLSDSASYTQRADGYGVTVGFVADCGPRCLLAGHGWRSLGDRLRQERTFADGPATVDNIYLTIIYEFGLVGLTAAVAGVAVALRRARSGHGLVRAGGVGLVTLALFGLTFDVAYWVGVLYAVAFFAALTSRRDGDDPGERDAHFV